MLHRCIRCCTTNEPQALKRLVFECGNANKTVNFTSLAVSGKNIISLSISQNTGLFYVDISLQITILHQWHTLGSNAPEKAPDNRSTVSCRVMVTRYFIMSRVQNITRKYY